MAKQKRKSGLIHTVEPSTRVLSQWCPAIEGIVTLRVQGSVFGDIIRGKVVECLKHGCVAKDRHPYCWVERIIQTRV